MTNNFHSAFSDFDGAVEKSPTELFGNLGVMRGGKKVVIVPGRPQYVYVRLRTKLSELIEAYNGNGVSQAYDLPVKVKREGSRYVIVDRNTPLYPDWRDDNPYLPRHAKTHSFDREGGNYGGDPVWVYPYQIVPGLVAPFGQRGASNVFIYPYTLYGADNQWKCIGSTGTERLTKFNPTSGSCLVLVNLDGITGNPVYYASTGTFIPYGTTGTNALLSYLPDEFPETDIPLAFARLTSGTTSIGWDRIYDVRQYLAPDQTGTAGGSLTINGQPEITQLNIGGSVSVGFTGSSYFVDVVGGSGGGRGSIGRFVAEGYLAEADPADEYILISSDTTINEWAFFVDFAGYTGTNVADIFVYSSVSGTYNSIFDGTSKPEIPYDRANFYDVFTPSITNFIAGDLLVFVIEEVGLEAYGAILQPVESSGGSGGSLTISDGTTDYTGIQKLIFPSSSVVVSGVNAAIIPKFDYILVRDEKSSGTNGGTFNDSSWQTRDINTIVNDDGSHCSIGSNQITMDAGRYRVHIACPAYDCDNHQARLYDISNSAVLLLGQSVWGRTASNLALVIGEIELLDTTILEIQHQCSATQADNGFGVGTGFGTEVYTVAEFTKVG